MTKNRAEGFKLTASERRDLDHLSRKAGIEVAIAEGDLESEEAAEYFLRSRSSTIKDYESCFPSKFGKKLPKEGKWILIKDPPPTQITVPPFSIWFATPWTMRPDAHGAAPHRVKITTPGGDIGVFPHEYAPVDSIGKYIGREKEGVLVHQMNGNPVCDTDKLFYLMSRGIKRTTACMLLIEQIKDPTWLWFECAPPYGAYFGRDWPSPKECPFATPLEMWKQVELAR